ncbi:hypothetical protein PHYSODRAFT_324703 [Phytophthora sojae]|uniref:Uncharacterized protein n=1 Tax=Phytophthora sojae (strain P6497) TaxID=1094619 RepID=G4YSK6_PHYSP|nr:hypothetical protein PHYSODRAFT_324703 [Phytophthora sojae]EGZ23499.1 hypothetical protein PHYSODRAFT_324703 [Phytophthora sojae]|eukprot:XP_009518787.1 hypothetical protein PHYSODRAFT_324703 [Phytophthora sojae]
MRPQRTMFSLWRSTAQASACLRTTETAAAVEKDEDKDEERAFQVQFLNKLNLPTYFGSPVGKDGTFIKTFVKALLKNKKLRKRTFQDWATANLDGNILKQSLGG